MAIDVIAVAARTVPMLFVGIYGGDIGRSNLCNGTAPPHTPL